MRNVIKFGGSSLCDGASMIKASKTVDGDTVAVVVSAPGKRWRGDDKITDLLYRSSYGDAAALENVRRRFENISRSALIKDEILGEIFTSDFKDRLWDAPFIASRGEFFSAKIMAELLGYEFVDAADVIVFDSGGAPDIPSSIARIKAAIKGKNVVIPGFYGANKNGNIVTFPRGGSDITGAVVAAAANAKIYHNRTDVSGFMFCAPEHCEKYRVIPKMTYGEAYFLSRGGAGVIHADAVEISRRYGTVINVRSSFDETSPGTLIGDFPRAFGVYGISGKATSDKLCAVSVGIHREDDGFDEARRLVISKTPAEPLETTDDGMVFSVPAEKFDKTMQTLAAIL